MPIDVVALGEPGERDGAEEETEVAQCDVVVPRDGQQVDDRKAEELGTQLGGKDRTDVFGLLERYGFEPRREDDAIVLSNCPFHALAQAHTQPVCGMNLHLLRGVLEGTGETGTEACLAPGPGRCRVRLQPAA